MRARTTLLATFLTLATHVASIPAAAIAQNTSTSRETRNAGAGAFTDTLGNLSASGGTTCLTTTAGAAYCWGSTIGQRDGTVYAILGPDSQPARLRSIAASDFSRCGLTLAGDVWCDRGVTGGWADSAGRPEPVPRACRWYNCVVPLPLRGSLPTGRLREVVSGGHHACALAPNGTAHCWGANTMGYLGNGAWAADSNGSGGETSRAPTAVVGGHRFSQITSKNEVTCGLTTSERHIYCWGYGQNGETGDSSIMSVCQGTKPYYNKPCSTAQPHRVLPESLPGDYLRAEDVKFDVVAAGLRMTCAISDAGEAYCWGSNYRCGLGRCRSAESSRARRIAIPGRVVEVAPGYWHACARTAERRVFCWGNNTAGQLGSLATANAGPDGGPPDYRSPASAGAAYGDQCFNGGRCSPVPIEVSPGRRWGAVALGENHACALADDDGGIYCWGGTDAAPLGRDARFVLCENRSAQWKDERCQPTPVRVPGLPALAPPRGSDRLAMPAHERAQAPVRQLQSTRVIANTQEVRVIFPSDSSEAWGWPSVPLGYVLRYYWSMIVDGVDGPRNLALRITQRDTTARTFPSLASLVGSEEPSLCTLDMGAQCATASLTATVEGDRVVLALDDGSIITRLFGLRPDSVSISRVTPDDPMFRSPVRVAVEYTEPRIPAATDAFRAEAARANRRHLESINWISRRIVGSPEGSPAIWIVLGDSIAAAVSEMRCTYDVCSSGRHGGGGGTWSVDDSTVVALLKGEQPYVVARALGRTTLSVRLPASPVDTMPFREPPPRVLRREVVVSPRAARIVISPRPESLRANQSLELRFRALDRSGRAITGAPIEVTHDIGSYNVRETTTGALHIVAGEPGIRTLIAKFGTATDTLRIVVLSDAKR